MINERMQDAKDGITRSQKGNIFRFSSPIPGVHIYDNVWPGSMDFFERLEEDSYWENPKYPGNIKWVREDYLDDETGKKSRTCWIWNDSEAREAFEEVVDSYLYHWNLDPRSRESLRITKFAGTGEFFGMHSDDSFATPRTTSMVYYPNDDYEGGDLEFIHFGVTIKPKAGQLFMFPSGYSYEHKVHPVTGGNPRITVVSFFNAMTQKERDERHSMIDPNKYYQPKLQYVFSDPFGD